jgi:hypothetical protein
LESGDLIQLWLTVLDEWTKKSRMSAIAAFRLFNVLSIDSDARDEYIRTIEIPTSLAEYLKKIKDNAAALAERDLLLYLATPSKDPNQAAMQRRQIVEMLLELYSEPALRLTSDSVHRLMTKY